MEVSPLIHTHSLGGAILNLTQTPIASEPEVSFRVTDIRGLTMGLHRMFFWPRLHTYPPSQQGSEKKADPFVQTGTQKWGDVPESTCGSFSSKMCESCKNKQNKTYVHHSPLSTTHLYLHVQNYAFDSTPPEVGLQKKIQIFVEALGGTKDRLGPLARRRQ